jgi:hypothetical protein
VALAWLVKNHRERKEMIGNYREGYKTAFIRAAIKEYKR